MGVDVAYAQQTNTNYVRTVSPRVGSTAEPADNPPTASGTNPSSPKVTTVYFDGLGRERSKVATAMGGYGTYEGTNGAPEVVSATLIYPFGGVQTWMYYVRDHLGSTRAVVTEQGVPLQATDYYPSGIPVETYSTGNAYNTTDRLHTGKEFHAFDGLSWHDNAARFPRFTKND